MRNNRGGYLSADFKAFSAECDISHNDSFALNRAAVRQSATLDAFCLQLDSLYRAGEVESIAITGTASPEGTFSYNTRLSQRRAHAVRSYITAHTSVPASQIAAEGGGEDWDYFEDIAPDRLSETQLHVVQDIINRHTDFDARERALRRRPALWRTLRTQVFPHLRRAIACVQLRGGHTLVSVLNDEGIDENPLDPGLAPDSAQVAQVRKSEPLAPVAYVVIDTIASTPAPKCNRDWSIGTNAIEWGMAISNIRSEYAFACHWSAALSVHYSAVNYFTARRKFRTFILRPEVRYWIDSSQCGYFIDVHAQMASYNVALTHWQYRIQDRQGKHPALGGGIGGGYKMSLGNGHWSLEGQIGIGVYHLDYTRYYNIANGQAVDSRHRTWFGIDNIALSFVYNFNRRGGHGR